MPLIGIPDEKKAADAITTIEELISQAPFMASAMSTSSRLKCAFWLPPSRILWRCRTRPGGQETTGRTNRPPNQPPPPQNTPALIVGHQHPPPHPPRRRAG